MDLSADFQLLSCTPDRPLVSRSMSVAGSSVNPWQRRVAPIADRFIPQRRHSLDAGDLLWRRAGLRRQSSVQPQTPTTDQNESGLFDSSTSSLDSPFAPTPRPRRSNPSQGTRRSVDGLLLQRSVSHDVGGGAGQNPYRLVGSRALSTARSFSTGDGGQGDKKASQDRVLNFFSPQESRRPSHGLRSTPRRSNSLYDDLHLSHTKQGAHRKVPTKPESSQTFSGVRNDIACNILSWGKKGVLALAIGNQIHLWIPRSGKPPHIIRAPSDNATGTESTTPGTVTGATTTLQPPSYDITSLVWNPPGTSLAFGTEKGEVWLMEDWDPNHPATYTTNIWRRPNTEVEGQEEGDHQQVNSLCWSPTSPTILYVGMFNGGIEYIDTSMSLKSLIGTAGGAIYRLAVSPDGRRLAASHSENMVVVICLKSLTPLHEFNAHKTLTKAVAWCPWKPNLLATGGCGEEDGYIRLWNAATGKLVQELDAGGEDVLELVWSENTRELVSGQGGRHSYVLIWPPSLSQHAACLSGHTAPVMHLEMSPDGTRLASAGADGVVNVWHCLEISPSRPHISPLPTSRLVMCIR